MRARLTPPMSWPRHLASPPPAAIINPPDCRAQGPETSTPHSTWEREKVCARLCPRLEHRALAMLQRTRTEALLPLSSAGQSQPIFEVTNHLSKKE